MRHNEKLYILGLVQHSRDVGCDNLIWPTLMVCFGPPLVRSTHSLWSPVEGETEGARRATGVSPSTGCDTICLASPLELFYLPGQDCLF